MTPARKRQPTKSAEAFLTSLGEAECVFRDTAVNVAALENAHKLALEAATRLRGYRDYLSAARAHKASVAVAGHDIDGQVLTYARDAANDLHTLSTAMLDGFDNLSRGGALDRMAASWLTAVDAAGGVSMRDVWKHVAASETNREAFHRAGIDSASLGALDEALGASDVRVSADGTRLIVASEVNGKTVQAALATTPRPARASNVAELLMRGRFDAVSSSLRQGEPAYLQGTPFLENDLHIEDVALNLALATDREGVRHVRKLEDTGLDTYLGGSPVAIIVVTVIVVLVVAGLYFAYLCYVESNRETEETGKQETSNYCYLAIFSFMAAQLSGIFWPSDNGQATPTNAVGSGLIQGVLRDFEASAA